MSKALSGIFFFVCFVALPLTCVVAQTPSPSLGPIDSCGIYNGTNSTCQCDSSKWKAWTTLGVSAGVTPLFLFAILRWWVFTDDTLPMLGVRLAPHAGPLAQKIYSDQWSMVLFWTPLGTAIVWLILSLRFIMDLNSSDQELCPNLNRFIWHVLLFYLLPLTFFVLCAIGRAVAYVYR